MLRKFVFLLTLTLASYHAFSQEFFSALWDEADCQPADYSKPIDIDLFNQVFFETGRVKMEIDKWATYQVLFKYDIHWEHHVGMEGAFTYRQDQAFQAVQKFTDTTYTPPGKIAYPCPHGKTYTGELLRNATGLKGMPPFEILTHFPDVYERDDEYNGQWTVFSNDEYLIFRYVHSYPHGNATSWYKEKLIYLKKLN